MTTKILKLFLLLLLITGCKKQKSLIVLDKRSFSIVNLIPEFPIINLFQALDKDDSIGLTCDKCEFENKKKYVESVNINRKDRNIEYKKLGWSPTYSIKYDTNNRIKNQLIISCYDWDITYTYLDTLGLVYQFSKIDKENEIDTTIYKLDSYGRVIQINGIEYGDLYKRSFTKRILYSGKSLIPDSISSIYKRKEVDEVRKETFFHSKDKIDSIRIERTNYDNNYAETRIFINYFDKQEIFINQRLVISKYRTEMFYVERLTK